VGPLARLWLSGEYRNGISAMDRIIARVLETRKIVSILNILIENLEPNIPMQKEYTLPEKADGKGLVDTTRGALAHYISIENKKISFYQLITPSVWNLSSQTGNMKGTAEMALMGTHVRNTQTPVEIGRVIRSFDPCVSCATHVYTGGELKGSFQVV
jgi:hydrogenase large subunit